MAQDLARFTFANKADKAISNSDWDVIYSSVNTLAGDDTITGAIARRSRAGGWCVASPALTALFKGA